MLNDETYSIVKRYESAVKNRDKALVRLNGTGDDNDTGLNGQLKDAKKKLDEVRTLVKSLGVKAKEVDESPIMTAYVQNVKDLESQIAQAEKSVNVAQDTILKYEAKYDAIMAKINDITLP